MFTGFMGEQPSLDLTQDKQGGRFARLEAELARAVIVSRVYPHEADIDTGNISVLVRTSRKACVLSLPPCAAARLLLRSHAINERK